MTPPPTPIAVAVVEHGDRFLVGRRPAGSVLAGMCEFPGGKVEAGETPEQAAVRECREETGLDVEVVHAYPRQLQDEPHGRLLLLFFACRPLAPETPPLPPFRWASRVELAELPFPAGNQPLLRQLATTTRQAPAR